MRGATRRGGKEKGEREGETRREGKGELRRRRTVKLLVFC